jgi:hypothetical protein
MTPHMGPTDLDPQFLAQSLPQRRQSRIRGCAQLIPQPTFRRRHSAAGP